MEQTQEAIKNITYGIIAGIIGNYISKVIFK